MTKQRAKRIIKYLFLVLMLLESIVLIAEALTPGAQSAQQSQAVGGVVDDLLSGDEVKDVPAESVLLLHGGAEKDALTVNIGTKTTLTAKVLPENTSVNHLKVVWTSSDESVVTAAGGVLNAKGLGTATVTVALEEDGTKSDSIEITVQEIYAESFVLQFTSGKDSGVVQTGKTAALRANLSPSGATGTVKYTSSNSKVATVSGSGVVTGVSVGTATITATYTSYTPKGEDYVTLSSSVTVTVEQAPEVEVVPPTAVEIALSDENGQIDYLFAGAGAKFSATVLPANCTDKLLVWSSSDESVLKVNSSGTVTALKKGKAVVTATCAANSKISASFELEVRNKTLGALISAEGNTNLTATDHANEFTVSVKAGTRLPLSVTAEPEEIYIRYGTSDKEIAEIDEGVLLPYRAAQNAVTLTVTVADNAEFSNENGNLTETFTILLTVTRQPFSETVQGWGLIIRKLFGHFGAFFVLGILAGGTTIFFERKDWKWRLIALLLLLICGFAFAGLTEILQLSIFTAGRTAAFTDVLIDYSGFAPAAIIVYGGYLIVAGIVEAVKKKRAT